MDKTMMTHAFAVLALLEPIAPDSWWLEAYSNGREQGFNVWDAHSNRRVSFSRDRGSDDIVVYCGQYSDFELQGNVPQQQTYTHINTFYFIKPQDASSFIFNYFHGLDVPW